MRMIIAFLTLSLVVCLTLCSNENRKEDNKDEFLEEILDRVKRDAVPQPRGNIYLFNYLFICFSEPEKFESVWDSEDSNLFKG